MESNQQSRQHRQFLKGISITSLGTLSSRVLGMLRDIATGSLFGMAHGGVMDAFVIAFRIPNLFRRLFGEGALTASYLPILTQQLQQNRKSAWNLATVVAVWLSIFLCGLIFLGELLLLGCWWLWGDDPQVELLVTLCAMMLPYTILICLTAQISATLQALFHFRTSAFVPAILNVCWLSAAILIAPHFTDPITIAYILTVSILIGGVLQIGVQLPALWKFGFRPQYDWQASRTAFMEMTKNMGPLMFGLAVTQINVFFDSMIAWGFSSEIARPIDWLSAEVQYPMRQGAAAATYIGQRLYHFPLGVLGMAIATVIFPLLSRHAARGERQKVAGDLIYGLRLVTFLSIPAGVGLMLLAEPIIRLLFEHGEFQAAEATRAARVLIQYSWGIWAFCCIPVITRGYYALQMRSTPVKIGIWIVGLNLLLNLILIWPLAESGLAVATSIAATVQAIALIVILLKQIDNGSTSSSTNSTASQLTATICRTLIVSLIMAGVCYATLHYFVVFLITESGIPMLIDTESLLSKAIKVILPIVTSTITFFIASQLISPKEYAMVRGIFSLKKGS